MIIIDIMHLDNHKIVLIMFDKISFLNSIILPSNFNLLWIGTWIKKVDMNKITMIDKFKALSNDWIFKKIIIAIINSAIIAGAAIKDM